MAVDTAITAARRGSPRRTATCMIVCALAVCSALQVRAPTCCAPPPVPPSPAQPPASAPPSAGQRTSADQRRRPSAEQRDHRRPRRQQHRPARRAPAAAPGLRRRRSARELGVGVEDPLLGRREHGLHLEARAVLDLPQGAAAALHRPSVGHLVLLGGQRQLGGQLVGHPGGLAEQDPGGAQRQQVLGDGHLLRPGGADRQQVRRLVQDQQLDLAFGPGQPQVGVDGLHRAQPEPHLPPHLVAHHDPDLAVLLQVGGHRRPGAEAGQRDGDGLVAAGAQQRQVHRLDRRVPVQGEVGRLVEQAGQRPDHQVGQRVGDRAGVVEELPAAGEPGLPPQLVVGRRQLRGHVRDGDRAQPGVAVGRAEQPAQHRGEHQLVGHRGPVALGLGQRGEQRGPPAEHPGQLLALPGDRPAVPARRRAARGPAR